MRKYKKQVHHAIAELRADAQATYQQHRHLLEWAKGQGYVEPKSDYPLTQPDPAPEQPAPFPWHPDVLIGKVSIVGGLVCHCDDGEPGKVLSYNAALYEWPRVQWHDSITNVHPLSTLRPAPHDWQPGDTAMVVGAGAWQGWQGRKFAVAEVRDGFIIAPDHPAILFPPPLLLYIPPAPAAQPDARGDDIPDLGEPLVFGGDTRTAEVRQLQQALRDRNQLIRELERKVDALSETAIDRVLNALGAVKAVRE